MVSHPAFVAIFGSFTLLSIEIIKIGAFWAVLLEKSFCKINNLRGVSPAYKKQGRRVRTAGERGAPCRGRVALLQGSVAPAISHNSAHGSGAGAIQPDGENAFVGSGRGHDRGSVMRSATQLNRRR